MRRDLVACVLRKFERHEMRWYSRRNCDARNAFLKMPWRKGKHSGRLVVGWCDCGGLLDNNEGFQMARASVGRAEIEFRWESVN